MLASIPAAACVLAFSLAFAPSASACALAVTVYSPPPYSGVSERQWQAQQDYREKLRAESEKRTHQLQLWDKAEQVFVARIETVSPRKMTEFWGGARDTRDVELRPVRWLKGTGADQTFTLGIQEWSDCGPDPRWDALWGKPGEEFIVYVENGAPTQASVMEAMAQEKLVDPRVKKALGLPQ
jgi:hypothetical protein